MVEWIYGTKMDHKWYQSGPGGEGERGNRKSTKEKEKANVKKQNIILFEMWGDVLKNRRAQRLGVYCSFFNKYDTNGI